MEARFVYGDFNISNLIGPRYDPATSPNAPANVQVSQILYCIDSKEVHWIYHFLTTISAQANGLPCSCVFARLTLCSVHHCPKQTKHPHGYLQ